MNYTPTVATTIFMSVFLAAYGAFLVRNTVRHRIDLFDFAMLALVAVAPAAVVYFPVTIVRFTRLIGVEFPFVVLFGELFLVVFIYLYSLVVRINAQQRTITRLVQDLGLLREALHEATRVESAARGER